MSRAKLRHVRLVGKKSSWADFGTLISPAAVRLYWAADRLVDPAQPGNNGWLQPAAGWLASSSPSPTALYQPNRLYTSIKLNRHFKGIKTLGHWRRNVESQVSHLTSTCRAQFRQYSFGQESVSSLSSSLEQNPLILTLMPTLRH